MDVKGRVSAMLPVLPVFLVGVVSAPLVKKAVRPVVRGTIKTSVKLAVDVKRAAHEINEDISDIAAEASAEAFAADVRGDADVLHAGAKKPRGGKAVATD